MYKMPTKHHAEEQFPLLLFIVGNEHENLNKTNKTFKSRLNGITSGATTVITEWPNYISSCWTTSFIIALTLFLMTLTFFSCINMESGHNRLPRCLPNNLNNETIHLVIPNSINHEEIDLLKTILDDFPNYKVNLITILNEYEFNSLSKKRARRDRDATPKLNSVSASSTPKNSSVNAINSTNNNTTKQSRILLTKIEQIVKIKQMMLMVKNNVSESAKQEETIEEIAEKNPNLQLSFETYNNVFSSSPLFMNWMLLNDDVRVLAVRILQLFQYGGLSFDMLRKHKLVKEFVNGGKKKFENLKRETVWIDMRGLHMATKIPCHAFFGNVLNKLHRSGPETSPESALKGAFKWFCRTKHLC